MTKMHATCCNLRALALLCEARAVLSVSEHPHVLFGQPLAPPFQCDYVLSVVFTSKRAVVDVGEMRSCAIFSSVSMILPVARRFVAGIFSACCLNVDDVLR